MWKMIKVEVLLVKAKCVLNNSLLTIKNEQGDSKNWNEMSFLSFTFVPLLR